jgi:hypothetical protein
MKGLSEALRNKPARGVLVDKRLLHWHELLEEWCLIQERYCRLVPSDAIYWQSERSNLAALAAAAWRAGWAALEEFQQTKLVEKRKITGRADLFLRSPISEDYVESKLVWCREGDDSRIKETLAGIDAACTDVLALHLEPYSELRQIGIVFAVPSFRSGDLQKLLTELLSLVEHLQETGLDAVAWCFPTLPQPCIWEGRTYPGVFLLAKRVR